MKTSIPLSVRFASLIAAASLALTASAQTPIKHADKSFIEKAAKAGIAEVDISRVAADRTSSPQVREFAQMLAADHQSANETLASIAESKAVHLPAKDTEVTEKWTKKGAKDFDKDYVEKMVSAHKEAVELFENEANKGQDTETKAFARETLPKLQRHLEMALDLKKTVK